MDKDEILFQETQRFKQWWMWLLIISPMGFGLYGIFEQIILGQSFGDKPMSDQGLVVFTLFGLAFAYFFWCHRLTLTITKKGIHVQFYPYVKKFVPWEKVTSMQIVDHGFTDAMGWGIRLWTKYGTVYNVKFGDGLYVQQEDKTKFLVSTDRRAALGKLLAEHFPMQYQETL